MWSERALSRAIDSHVQGINHPNAPWNQEEAPMCEDCEVEDCKEPCGKLIRLMEENHREQLKAERGLYMAFLLDETDETILRCDEAVILDYVGLTNLVGQG